MERNYHFDNLKALLIFLVVFGHLIEPIRDIDVFKSIYFIIYSFHMPLFIFLTGYFSKPNTKGLAKTLRTFIIYDIIFALSYVILFGNTAGGGGGSFLSTILFALQPVWILWYLLSIIWWRFLLIFYEKYPRLEFLIIAVIIIFNFIPFNLRILSIGRTLSFFPFYILGYIAKERNFNFKGIRKDKHKLIYLLIILIIFWSTYSVNISDSLLYGTDIVLNQSSAPMLVVLFKVVTYLVAISASLLVISITPTEKTRYSEIGTKTMPIFIYHIFFVWGFMKIGFYEEITQTPTALAVVLLLILSFSIVMILKDRRVL